MPFPTEGWPPRVPTSVRSLRFYTTGTATAAFADNAFLFIDGAGANPYVPTPVVRAGSSTPTSIGDTTRPGTFLGTGRAPTDVNYSMPDFSGQQAQPKAAIWSAAIRIVNNSGAALEFSFDGTNVAGKLLPNTEVIFRERREAGICVRGAGTFWVEAW